MSTSNSVSSQHLKIEASQRPSVTIFDSKGSLIARPSISAGTAQSTYSADISQIPQGSYIVSVKAGQENLNERFILTR
jgi:hypothetical protein